MTTTSPPSQVKWVSWWRTVEDGGGMVEEWWRSVEVGGGRSVDTAHGLRGAYSLRWRDLYVHTKGENRIKIATLEKTQSPQDCASTSGPTYGHSWWV